MKQRIITSLILVAILLPILILGGIPLLVLVAVASILAEREILNLTSVNWTKTLTLSMYAVILILNYSGYFGLKYYLFANILELIYLITWLVFDESTDLESIGVTYMVNMVLSTMCFGIYRMYDVSKLMMIFMLCAPIASDISAYFIGSAFGKHKFNERISPKKTMEGFIGGISIAAVIQFLFGYFALCRPLNVPVVLAIVSALTMPTVSAIGDLFFSAIKRHYGVKDYSNLFPGHGGVLDRLDSISFSCMWMLALMVIIL